VSGYTEGRAVEYAVVHDLQDNGYDTIRGASSKGLADVVGIHQGRVVLVNCKRTTMPGPAERAELLRVAGRLPGMAIAVVALKPRGNPHPNYRHLHGPGPRDWWDWTPSVAE
jgi:Holliday junction resolvase